MGPLSLPRLRDNCSLCTPPVGTPARSMTNSLFPGLRRTDMAAKAKERPRFWQSGVIMSCHAFCAVVAQNSSCHSNVFVFFYESCCRANLPNLGLSMWALSFIQTQCLRRTTVKNEIFYEYAMLLWNSSRITLYDTAWVLLKSVLFIDCNCHDCHSSIFTFRIIIWLLLSADMKQLTMKQRSCECFNIQKDQCSIAQ